MNQTLLSVYWNDTFREELENTTIDEGMSIWALGGACVNVRTPESVLFLDPYLGGPPPIADGVELHRSIAIPVDPQRITRADAVFISHEHYDHCHKDTLIALANNTESSFYGPVSAVKLMHSYGLPRNRTFMVKPGDRIVAKDSVVTVWPGYDAIEPEAVTYVVESSGVKLFFGGDSTSGPAFSDIGSSGDLDIAMLAFGRTWYMSESEMLDAAEILRPKLLLPYHWELWRGHTGDVLELGLLVERRKPSFDVKLLLLGDNMHYVLDEQPGKGR